MQWASSMHTAQSALLNSSFDNTALWNAFDLAISGKTMISWNLPASISYSLISSLYFDLWWHPYHVLVLCAYTSHCLRTDSNCWYRSTFCLWILMWVIIKWYWYIMCTWSIIRVVNGDTVRTISVSLSIRGSEKQSVFPLPVPTSMMTSSPHRIATAISSCQRKGFMCSIVKALAATSSRLIFSFLYQWTFDWMGMVGGIVSLLSR